MKTLRLVLALALGWLLFAIPTFAQFRDPIGPYAAPQAEPGSTDAPGADPSEVQSRGMPPEPQPTGEQEATSSATGPTTPDEPVPPEEETDIQERGILPGVIKPGATLQFSAPTPSLTAIRNAIRLTSKSISVNLRIPANLPVTVPVEVEVFYSSPFQSRILKRTYSPATGLTLSYREAEGNGEPRKMKVTITVRELVPNGQVTGLNKEFTLTPLYDVFVTDLRFVMALRCDSVGKSDISFRWYSPDRQRHEQKFKLGEGETKGITQFSWTRKEISTRANLVEPMMLFVESDPSYFPPSYDPVREGPSDIPLVPGPTTKHHFLLKNEKMGPPGLQGAVGGNACVAEITYTIIRALMPFD
ncbi:MAG: hypothetical protein P0111_10515 [Nitrospira sp.]|nr:hypothetical protein [Nitrospira sp.]